MKGGPARAEDATPPSAWRDGKNEVAEAAVTFGENFLLNCSTNVSLHSVEPKIRLYLTRTSITAIGKEQHALARLKFCYSNYQIS